MAKTQGKKLTARQQSFVHHYLTLGVAREAAIKAGYSEKTAEAQGWQLLQIPIVQEALEKARAKVAELAGLSALKVAMELKRIGFADMANYADWGPDGVRLKSSDEEGVDTAVVSEVSEHHTYDKMGTLLGTTLKFKLHDKKSALDSINKMFGWNAPDKTELTGKDGGPIEVTDAKARLAERLSRANKRPDPGEPGQSDRRGSRGDPI